MKKSEITSILVVAFCLILYACESIPEKKVTVSQYYDRYRYKVVEIDSCEYVVSMVHSGYSICHKGNCKFCLERNHD
jgi:starvation-inducible outer membrane lipoprotein